MTPTYLIDTNVLLFDPQALSHFQEATLLVPLEVIEDLDKFKHGADETGRNARDAAYLFDALRKEGSLKDGVHLPNGCLVRVVTSRKTGLRSDQAILAHARKLKEDGETPLIVTKSVNLRVKADALGLSAQDYGQDVFVDTEEQRGWRRLWFSRTRLAVLQEGRPVPAGKQDFFPNEYVFAVEKEHPKNACCLKYRAKEKLLCPLLEPFRKACGVGSLNVEQTFALDALLDPDISLVTLAGRGGTGKTLLAIAAALQQLFAENRYDKLLVFRPTVAVSRDLGYLPGDLNEKMRPWMQPVYDALELIRSLDRKSPARVLPNDLMNCPEISVEPLTYIRGRSIPNQFIIIDEAQNLTPLEVKTAITRVGHGSKIVLTGDPAQIDNPYVDSRSNGLTQLVGRFLASPIAAHITLVKGERSELAETASRLL